MATDVVNVVTDLGALPVVAGGGAPHGGLGVRSAGARSRRSRSSPACC